MEIADLLMILAVLVGPLIAIQLTRYLDNLKERREKRVKIFKTLMATRSYGTSWIHVEALNQIDLEFNTKSDKDVIIAWKAYLDLLGTKSMSPEQWNIKQIDLLVEMLHKMSSVLGYDFDKTHIKNSSYIPLRHGNTEMENDALRQGLLQVLSGDREIPISIGKVHKNLK